MRSDHDVDQGFDALHWIISHAVKGPRESFRTQIGVARTLYKALPPARKMERLNAVVKSFLALFDHSKIIDADNRRTILQIANSMQTLTNGLNALAHGKKPSPFYYSALNKLDEERETARVERRSASPVKTGPVRGPIKRLFPRRNHRPDGTDPS